MNNLLIIYSGYKGKQTPSYAKLDGKKITMKEANELKENGSFNCVGTSSDRDYKCTTYSNRTTPYVA